jgi:hypothetical protein
MTWRRETFSAALADALETAAAAMPSGAPTVFSQPPLTLNAPAVVVGRPAEVVYGTGGLGVDMATIPVICLGPLDGSDVVDELIAFVRGVVDGDAQLGGLVQMVHAPSERNWRSVRIGGADFLAADVQLAAQM